MQIFPHRTPAVLIGLGSLLLPKAVWRAAPYDTQGRPVAYLTFDDGPIPTVTNWVLDTLAQHNAKGTFFCLGKNIEANPDVFKRIVEEGHTVGNHTYNHVDGSVTDIDKYLSDTDAAAQVMSQHLAQLGRTSTVKYFRPPYGRVSRAQHNAILKRGYELVRWHIIAGDWQAELDAQVCATKTASLVQPGSIIVLHDSLKAERNMKPTLEAILKLPFQFHAL